MPARELKRVLVVEDDPDIRAVVALSLSELGGLTVSVADSGPEALAAAASFAPDVVLLDVMMPGMDGLATLRELRARPATAGIPVVFLTARVQPHETSHYLELGSIGVIPKPFEPTVLTDTLLAIWREHAG